MTSRRRVLAPIAPRRAWYSSWAWRLDALAGSSRARNRIVFGMRGRWAGPCTGSTRRAHARVGAKTSQHATVLGHFIVAFGRLQDLHHSREAWLTHDAAERLGTERDF